MYPSGGGCDEFLKLYLHRAKMSKAQLSDIEGKLTGNIEEGEMIKLQVYACSCLFYLRVLRVVGEVCAVFGWLQTFMIHLTPCRIVVVAVARIGDQI